MKKTERLYRNLKNRVTLDEVDVETRFPKEGVVRSRESRSSEKFTHGITVLMAKNYPDHLSAEVRKGMQEKADRSIRPRGRLWATPKELPGSTILELPNSALQP